MDRLEIRTEVLENLDDLGINYYSELDANDAIKDAYDKIAVNTGCLTKAVQITSPVGTAYWNVKEMVPDYLYPVGLYSYSAGIWLEGRHPKSLDQYHWDWELWGGNAEWFCPIDYRRLAVVPHELSSPTSYLLLYRAVPPELSDSSQFPIIQPLQNVLVHHSLADLLEQAKEYSKAQIHWDTYSKMTSDVKLSVKNLAQVDKVRVLAPFMPLPRFGPGV